MYYELSESGGCKFWLLLVAAVEVFFFYNFLALESLALFALLPSLSRAPSSQLNRASSMSRILEFDVCVYFLTASANKKRTIKMRINNKK